MTKRGDAIIFCRILAPPHGTPPPPTPQYLFILMTVSTIIFCRILVPPHATPPPPPHSPDATILIYRNDKEGAPLFVVEF